VHLGCCRASAERHAAAAGRKGAPRRIIGVHDDDAVRPQIVGELRLRLEVRVHRTVIVEMIARQVREDGDVERDAVGATLLQRVRRYFHRDATNADVGERAKQPLELDRPGGRESVSARHWLAVAAENHAERPDRRAARARLVEQVAQHVDCRCLAVRPRDAEDASGVGRAAKCGRGGQRGSTPSVANDERRQLGAGHVFDDGRAGTGRRGRVEIGVSVPLRPANGNKQRAGYDAAAVVSDV
jgi:hypothetical protein